VAGLAGRSRQGLCNPLVVDRPVTQRVAACGTPRRQHGPKGKACQKTSRSGTHPRGPPRRAGDVAAGHHLPKSPGVLPGKLHQRREFECLVVLDRQWRSELDGRSGIRDELLCCRLISQSGAWQGWSSPTGIVAAISSAGVNRPDGQTDRLQRVGTGSRIARRRGRQSIRVPIRGSAAADCLRAFDCRRMTRTGERR
jgi:hypothetical protein